MLNCEFEDIEIQNKGGNVIRFQNDLQSKFIGTLTKCQFKNITANGDNNGRGGSALYAEMKSQSSLTISNNCQFVQCINNDGNGGALYIDISFTPQSKFKIDNALIKECQAKADTSSSHPTGYGGGIFLTGSGDYDILSNGLDFHGMNISDNSADKGGFSLYAVMSKLKEWCRSGQLGEYVKGNYTDGESNKNELQGIPVSSTIFNSYSSNEIYAQQKYLEAYWGPPLNDIWHIQSGTIQLITAEDQYYCGNSDEPCGSIEYALKQISIWKGGSETSDISEKKIGINKEGFELTNPIEFNSNQSKLTIPIIYIEGINSILELNTVTFSEINLSPTDEAKGIIHININDQQINMLNC
ncbi:MAG: hypothetical protein EZS28_046073, partial [Streblomastix strix]